VVVIDDQPEVSMIDAAFLFDSNDGFQEVTSKKTQKSKQKAALEESIKKTKQEQLQQAQLAAAQAKKAEKEAKVARHFIIAHFKLENYFNLLVLSYD